MLRQHRGQPCAASLALAVPRFDEADKADKADKAEGMDAKMREPRTRGPGYVVIFCRGKQAAKKEGEAERDRRERERESEHCQ